MKFIELAITGYRSLVDITLPLHPLTVMAGSLAVAILG
jgi:predicted ATPase